MVSSPTTRTPRQWGAGHPSVVSLTVVRTASPFVGIVLESYRYLLPLFMRLFMRLSMPLFMPLFGVSYSARLLTMDKRWEEWIYLMLFVGSTVSSVIFQLYFDKWRKERKEKRKRQLEIQTLSNTEIPLTIRR